MKYKVANAEYINNLKQGDDVCVLVQYGENYLRKVKSAIRKGKFVKRTPTGKLSIQYDSFKDWLNGDGKRSMSADGWHFDRLTLIVKNDDAK